MARPLLVTAVFLCGVLLGRSSAARLALRRNMLGDLTAAVRRMLLRMEYERLPLWRVVGDGACGVASPVLKAFAAALQRGAAPPEAWRSAEDWALLHDRAFAALHPGDREVLRAFMGALGSAALHGEQQNANLALAELERRREEAGAAYGSKGRVYRAMGVLCGAAVAILLL